MFHFPMEKSILLLCCAAYLSGAFAKGNFPSTWDQFSVSSHQGDMHSLFSEYKRVFNKVYLDERENSLHFSIFSQKVHNVLDWNTDGTKSSYQKGINKFTDMQEDQRKSYVMKDTPARATKLGRQSNESATAVAKTLSGIGSEALCDLRPFTTPVKDQGNCGSCWAFGTIAAAEGSHFLFSQTDSSGKIPSEKSANDWQLSEQVLVECCDAYDCNGCGGGGTYEPMQCAIDIGALPSTVSHPYLAMDNGTCSHTRNQASAFVEEWFEPCSLGDEVCIRDQIGGKDCSHFYSVALKTSIEVIDSFYDYAGGVYSDPACPDDIHNHAVAIVGWGTDEATKKDYWIIRNSWGEDWGLSGHIYMERGSNMCCVGCENLFFQ